MNRRCVALALAALPAFTGACASSSSQIRRLYAEVQHDPARDPGVRPDRELLERRAVRATKAREIAATGELKSASDLLKASVILVESDEAGDLKLAEELALLSARKGETLGLRVAAEAVDKAQIKQGLLQRYGTQYEWVPVLRAWRLYPIDPLTSDADRLAMGIPPMAELLKAEEQLNRKPGSGSK